MKCGMPPTGCEDCVFCREHRIPLVEDEDDGPNSSVCEFCKPGEPCEECRLPSDHDVAECSCNVGSPCEHCVAACEADEHKKLQLEVRTLKAGILAMISRNGFCVVCERYAPMHMVFCPIG